MPLRVKILAEPFTEYSKSEEPILAQSDEYRRLYRDLERYTSGQIQGRSYLIAGHRGSGKTMLVHKTVEDLLRDSAHREHRPLFVRLHGPDLLPPLKKKPVAPDEAHEEGAAKGKPRGQHKGEQKKPGAAEEEAGGAEEKEADPEDERADGELKIVLRQMTKSLFRAVTEEYRRCYRELALGRPEGLERNQLLEVASQFDLELTEALTESLTPSRLRSYWQRMGALHSGIIFADVRRSYRTYRKAVFGDKTTTDDIAFQEMLVLAFLSQAFQVVSGKLKETQSQTDAAKRESTSALSTAYALKNLFAPVAGLLTGGFVGLQVNADPVTAVLLGLLTGAVVSFGFNFSSTRTRTRNTSLESVFIRDRNVPTLSSVLPMLVVRLKEIGLAPIFVIDELDKVHDLNDRMQNLIRHLKFLVTENSFSCFLTDRRYLTYLNQQANFTAYAREYTYFSDRLLVLYPPAELRKFIKNVLDHVGAEGEGQAPAVAAQPNSQVPADAAQQKSQFEEEAERIAYVILHRSRLHPVDVRRQIDRLSAKGTFTAADAFPLSQYRLELLMQVAIETILSNDDVQSQIGADLESRQVVYDALYYVSRLWEDASDAQALPGFRFVGKQPTEKKPGFVLDRAEFAKYLESRCEEETEGVPKPHDPPTAAARQAKTGGIDFDFLFDKVSDLVNVLTKPLWFIESLASSKAVPPHILNALTSEQVLIEYIPETNEYMWLYDFSGRYVQTLDVTSVIREVGEPVGLVRGRNKMLQQGYGAEMNLQTMARLNVIPRTPPWEAVELALERLSRLTFDRKNYSFIGADRDCIIDFRRKMVAFEPNMKAALMCAALLARDIPGQPAQGGAAASTGVRLSASLSQVSQFLKLRASQGEDLQRLNSVLDSPFTGLKITPADKWEVLQQSALAALAETKPRDPAPIVESAWVVFKDRFTQRFREGFSGFEPRFEDLYTSLLGIGPGRNLSFDLSAVTAAHWSFLLARSLNPADEAVPYWMRVAAALELNMPDLAEKLSAAPRENPTSGGAPAPEDPLTAQWARDFRLRTLTPPEGRRNILILAAEGASLTASWKPSARHGSLVLTAADFDPLFKTLRRFEISKLTGFAIDLVCVELAGDRASLGRFVRRHPLDVLGELSSGKRDINLNELAPFFEAQDICYLVNETPQLPPTGPKSFNYVVSPKGIDDVVERLSPSPAPTSR